MIKSLLKSFFYRFGYSIHKVRPTGARAALEAEKVGGRLLPLIHAESPFAHFPLGEYGEDLAGWGSQSVAFDQLLAERKPQRITKYLA